MSEPNGKARVFFTELVDAVRYSDNWAGYLEKEKEAESNAETQTEELDGLVSRVSALFEELNVEDEYLKSMPHAVNQFVLAAVGQAKGRVGDKLKATMAELSSEATSEKLKAVKNLESYLSVTPLPVVEERVALTLTDGSYAAEVRYTCPDGIKYEFLLNTADSTLFRTKFSLAAYQKGAKIPARLGKAWIRKEPVPDFERLDAYFLSEALASQNQLIAKFVKSGTKASISVVYSRSDGESFVTIEYSDENGKVDVTGEPALSKHLDLAFMKDSMSKLLEEVGALYKKKLKLTHLELDEQDVLESMDSFGFMQRVVNVMVQSKDIIEAVRKLDQATWDRLKLLGDRGSTIAAALGLQVRNAKRP